MIDTSTNMVIATINSPFVCQPKGLAITPDGTRGYVVCQVISVFNVFVIDTATNTVVDRITAGQGGNNGVAITPF